MTKPIYGQTVVAKWCGVGTNAISMWISRYDDWPQPVVEILSSEDPDHPTSRYPIRGWSPEQRPAWEAYAAKGFGERHWKSREVAC